MINPFPNHSYVGMRIEAYEIRMVRSVATDRSDVLVGRNVLNRFSVTLDGRTLTFAIEDS